MIVIGDAHGCFYTLMDLMNKLPQTENICFVGDLIDRGPHSKEVVNFVMENNYSSVLGNHEDMICDLSLWLINGGAATLTSFGRQPDIHKNIEIFAKTKEKEWLESLPLIIEWKNFIISHSYAYAGDKTNADDILWGRNFNIPSTTDKINIFGHTPMKEAKKIKDKDYCIDTGCVFGHSLTAIDLETMKIYSVKKSKKDNL